MAETVAEHGLVQVMRDLQDKDAGWLGVQLEVRRRLRTDPEFAQRWAEHQSAVTRRHRPPGCSASAQAGVVRDDVPLPILVDFLRLVLDGLVSSLAAGMPTDHLGRRARPRRGRRPPPH